MRAADREDTGFLEVGARCHTCGTGSFLPHRCRSCGHSYCDEHAGRAHGCEARRPRPAPLRCPLCERVLRAPAGAAADALVSEHLDSGCTSHLPPAPAAAGCCATNCRAQPTVPLRCARCGKATCVQHRQPEKHQCGALAPRAATAAGTIPARAVVVRAG
mmetsp:Transcript_6097/g.20523  ORF Transcript_6097/g.20523 Transcript_6097/m.20523 type:complete len:160 (-) Transcript_6097:46-525(-)